MAQRLARDERHNIEEEVVLRAGGEDWEDVRVLQVGSDSDFLPEARSTDLAREFGREQFYDDLPVERRLSREEETRSEEHTSELQSRLHLVCRLLLEKKKNIS